MNYKVQINIAVIIIVFRHTLSIFIPSFNILSFGIISLFILYNFILNGGKIRGSKSVIPLFVVYLLMHIVFFGYLQPSLDTNISILGASQLLMNLVFWYSLYLLNYKQVFEVFKYFRKIIILYSIVISVGAIIQFYFSPTLYGLINNRLYSNESVLYGIGFARRGISFITSPQNLGIFLGLAVTIISSDFKNHFSSKIAFYIFLLTSLFAGILSGSKSFYLFILIYFFLLLFKDDKRKLVFILVLIMLLFPVLFPVLYLSETVQRVFLIIEIGDISKVGVFSIWAWFINDIKTFLELMFGQGLGLMSGSSQILYNYRIYDGSTESFLLQLLYELGMAGVSLWLIIYIQSIMRLLKNEENKVFAYMLIALISNILFTPSFYGVTTSFFFYSIIIFGLFSHKVNYQVKLQNK